MVDTGNRAAVGSGDRSRWHDRMYRAHPTPGDGALVRWFQDARHRSVLSMARVRPGQRVLEVGCEAGRLLACMPAGTIWTGLDISALALADGARRFRETGKLVDLVRADAEISLPFQPGAFDVIICSQVLEHAFDPHALLGVIAEICGKATRLVLTVPLERRIAFLKDFLDRCGLLQRLLPGVSPGRSPWHRHAFTVRTIRRSVSVLFDIRCEKTVLFWTRALLLTVRRPAERRQASGTMDPAR